MRCWVACCNAPCVPKGGGAELSKTARRSAVRQLKRRYHPDRFPRSLRGILTQVSAFINLQTQGLS